MKVTALFLTLLVGLLGGCSSMETHRNPGADLSKARRFYVERRLTDNHQIDKAIVAELKSLGFEASSGPMTMMPDAVDALVRYEDVWAWDFKSYLLLLSIDIRHPHTNQSFGVGSYRQPSFITKTPAEVIRQILHPLLPAASAKPMP